MGDWKDRRRALGALGIAWAVVAVVAVVWGVNQAQDDLGERAESALAAAGIDGVVAMEGRDAAVTVYGSASADEALRVVAAVEGIRRAGPAGVVAAGDVPDEPTPAPPTTAVTAAPPTSTSTSTTTTTTTTATATAPTTTTTTTTAPPVEAMSRLTARLEDGTLFLSGTIPSEEVAAGIAQVADLIYAPFVVNELTVDASVPPASWLPGAPRAVAVLPIVGSAQLDLAGESASLSGSTGSPQKAALFQGAVQQAIGDAISVQAEVAVTDERPPLYDAVARDGGLVIRGEMPDQAAVDRILGAAVAVYGADNVTNEMTIGDGVETTFSLFRVPLTFQLLQPVPEWEVLIENDVISGGLRGGATFPFESAELTPELERLAGVAAGILLRNPTVAITIEGHTDDVGGLAFNQRLSEARAQAAVEFINGLGVGLERLTAVGYGETRPIGDNNTDAGRAQNRRLEFVMGPAGSGGGQ